MAQATILRLYKKDDNGNEVPVDLTEYIAVEGYKVSVQDVDYESGRVASGLMVRNRKAVKRKIEVTFKAGLSSAEIHSIHNRVKAEKFKLTYTDPTQKQDTAITIASGSSNYYGTGDFYVGDRTFPRYSDALGLWSPFNIDFVEY